MSSPGQVAEEQVNLYVSYDDDTMQVSNVYYVIRRRAEDGGRTEFKKVDCRHQYTGNFRDVYLIIENGWFRIDCFNPLKEGGVSGTILHQVSDLMEFGVEYLPHTKRVHSKIEIGNQGNK